MVYARAPVARPAGVRVRTAKAVAVAVSYLTAQMRVEFMLMLIQAVADTALVLTASALAAQDLIAEVEAEGVAPALAPTVLNARAAAQTATMALAQVVHAPSMGGRSVVAALL
jgi:hypothetical protein